MFCDVCPLWLNRLLYIYCISKYDICINEKLENSFKIADALFLSRNCRFAYILLIVQFSHSSKNVRAGTVTRAIWCRYYAAGIHPGRSNRQIFGKSKLFLYPRKHIDPREWRHQRICSQFYYGGESHKFLQILF